ncbi:hypothetical protein [Embleya sp. NPDC050493]|uniref:hypothetical protein n=1 Tax=Embleya sp. NPDC050493 TaxID=3363989 RepID=UPI00379CB9E0
MRDESRVAGTGVGFSGALRPLAGDLIAPRREFAEALRRLFETLGISVRRYGARRHLDPATVSRYLNGTRIPPMTFVGNLLSDAYEHRGVPLTLEAEQHCRRLYDEVLRAEDPERCKVQLLRDRLELADEHARQAALREEVLTDAVRDRQHRISDLQDRMRRLRLTAAAERASVDAALEAGAEERSGLEAECERLRREVRRLEGELADAHRRTLEAERQCDMLERQLEAADTGITDRDEAEVARTRAEASAAKQSLEGALREMEGLRREIERSRALEVPPKPHVGSVVDSAMTLLMQDKPQWAMDGLREAARSLPVEYLVDLYRILRLGPYTPIPAREGTVTDFGGRVRLMLAIALFEVRPRAHLRELERQLRHNRLSTEAAQIGARLDDPAPARGHM